MPVAQTSSPVPVDLINDTLRLPYRDRLRIIINELGTGLAGRTADLNAVIRRAVPGLRETIQTLDILDQQRYVIQHFISDSDVVLHSLAARKREVERFVVEAAKTAAISATRKSDLALGFQRLPGFLDQLRPTMAQLSNLVDKQVPLLQTLQAGAPDLTGFLDQLGPFSQQSLPSLRSLASASVVGNRAFVDSSPDVAKLRLIANDAPGTARPLRQLLQTMDTRARSIYPDPRAAQSAPPAPDPTSDANGKGFTGLEAIWNYFYWQTLAINPFDQVSHYLRAESAVSGTCAPYTTDPSPGLAAQCNSYLGPHQPGILGQPDPSPYYPGINRGSPATGSSSSSSSSSSSGAAQAATTSSRAGGATSAAPQHSSRAQPQPPPPPAGALQQPPALPSLPVPTAPAPRSVAPAGQAAPPADSASVLMALDYLLGP